MLKLHLCQAKTIHKLILCKIIWKDRRFLVTIRDKNKYFMGEKEEQDIKVKI
jgi:hypothetical protein